MVYRVFRHMDDYVAAILLAYLFLLVGELEASVSSHEALHHSAQAGGAVVVHSRDEFTALGPDPCQPRIHMRVKEAVDVGTQLSVQGRECLHMSIHDTSEYCSHKSIHGTRKYCC